MNNLKYRCWHKIEKRFVDLRYIDFENETIGYDSQGEFNRYEKERFKNVVFQQFTGLKDRNGNLIYEGDIVKIHNSNPTTGEDISSILEVYFDQSFFQFRLKHRINSYTMSSLQIYGEIIGNIFENKELLK